MKRFSYLVLFFAVTSCTKPSYDIAFVSDRNGDLDIFLANSNTAEIRQLTHTQEIEYNLSWDKNGDAIYYTLYTKEGRQINKLNLETDSISIVIKDTTILAVFDVSKNGKDLLIATTQHDKKGELYLYSLITQEKTRITDNSGIESGAKFSPDEEFIVTSIQSVSPENIDHGGGAEIFVIALKNKKEYQVTDLGGFNALPAYSPDGEKIAFHNCLKGQCDIYVMDNDGSHVINLTKDISDNRWPRWTPDSKTILFTRTNINSDIYSADVNGVLIKSFLKSSYRDEIAEIRPK